MSGVFLQTGRVFLMKFIVEVKSLHDVNAINAIKIAGSDTVARVRYHTEDTCVARVRYHIEDTLIRSNV